MPCVVGLTGGIATGKSTVSAIWASQGATIIDADQVARLVVRPGRPAYRLIRRHFGAAVIRPDGTLDRAALGAIVFSDAAQRAALNRRIHPFIMFGMLSRLVVAVVFQWRSVIVFDAPLLFESGTLLHFCSRVVVVACSRGNQVERMVRRDAAKGVTEEEATKRIDSQMPIEQKMVLAVGRGGDVISNNGSRDELERAAKATLQELIPRQRNEMMFRTLVIALGVKLVSILASLIGP